AYVAQRLASVRRSLRIRAASPGVYRSNCSVAPQLGISVSANVSAASATGSCSCSRIASGAIALMQAIDATGSGVPRSDRSESLEYIAEESRGAMYGVT